MASTIGTNTNNPVKGPTPRQGNAWWILVIILLVLAGIFFAVGRSNDDASGTPSNSPAASATPRDQISNTARTGNPEMPIDGVQPNDDGPTTEDLTIPANDPASDREIEHIEVQEEAGPGKN